MIVKSFYISLIDITKTISGIIIIKNYSIWNTKNSNNSCKYRFLLRDVLSLSIVLGETSSEDKLKIKFDNLCTKHKLVLIYLTHFELLFRDVTKLSVPGNIIERLISKQRHFYRTIIIDYGINLTLLKKNMWL